MEMVFLLEMVFKLVIYEFDLFIIFCQLRQESFLSMECFLQLLWNRWRAHQRRRKTVLVSVGVAFYWISFLRGGAFERHHRSFNL